MKEKELKDYLRFVVPAIELAVCLSLVPLGQAATVMNCDEASLRGAIAEGGTVTFACDGVIAVTSPIEITNTVVLDATGRNVALSGSGASRVFLVSSSGNVTLIGLGIVDGFHLVEGAGILNLGNLAVQRCVLSNNVSFRLSSGGSGGAIANRGVLYVSETTFVTNLVYLEGGAIYNAGSLQVTRCAFIGNRASFGGGAISSRTSPQLPPTGITNCTFYGNAGRASDIYNAAASLQAGLVYAVNCTFSTGVGASIGGVASTAPQVWVANSIVSGSTNFFMDGGSNLLESSPDNLHLGPLANNGGPTLTRELLPDSPAIDQGDNAVCPPVDQRGVARPIRARCDIGALETSTSPTPGTIQFASPTFSVTEGATNARVSVLRLGNSGGSATVHFSTADGSATSGQDFVPTSGTLTFAGGQVQADILVSILDDLAPEPSETLIVNLDSASGNASLGSPTSAMLTIEDDDPVQPGTLQFQRGSYGVAEGSGRALVVVNRVGGTNGVVSVTVTTSDGTAIAGQDYVPTNATLTFGDTESRKSFTVEILDDPGNDGLETFSLTLSNPVGGAAIGIPSVTTITIADTAHTLSNCDETSLRAAVSAGGKVQFTCDGTITLTSPLVVSNGVFLDANGHEVTVSGGNAVRPFVIQPGITLELQNLTLADGYAAGTNGGAGQSGGPGEGGGIYNDGGLLVASGCTFMRNRALGGTGGPLISPIVRPQGGPARGGVIYNGAQGHVRATNCSFVLNYALGGDSGGQVLDSTAGGDGSGGAFYNAGGTVLLDSCRVSNNRAASGRNNRIGGLKAILAHGGAIHNADGELSLSHVELASNSVSVAFLSGASGGAIHQEAGLLKMVAAYLHDNRVEGGSGAGIGSPFGYPGGPSAGGALHINSGSAEIRDSTFSKNISVGGKTASLAGTGPSRGGGIFNAGTLNLQNSTLVGNEAFAKDGPTPFYGGSSYGGGLCSTGGVVVLMHVTIAANSTRAYAVQQGGGVYSTNGTVTLRNSIVANSPSGSNCFGAIMDGGHNLSSDDSANFTAPGSLNNTDPVLGPLADYGGPTPTMALLAGSPAVDAADGASCPETDQRGIARPFGAGCDIGAFESSPPYTILGRITGYTTPASGISLSVGSSSTPVGANGQYAMHGLATGSYTVTPQCSEAVFLLSNRVVIVGPDLVGLDFHSYRSNALTMEHISSGIVRAVFAGEAGQTHRVLLSTNLQQWDSYSTNTVQSSGLFDFLETNSASPLSRFFETVQP